MSEREIGQKIAAELQEMNPTMSGQKIIDSLRDAIAGNFSRVTIDGHVWVKLDVAQCAGNDDLTTADPGTITRNLRGLASRMEYRVEAIEQRDGKGAGAIQGQGIGIGYLLAKDLANALTEAAAYIEHQSQVSEGDQRTATHALLMNAVAASGTVAYDLPTSASVVEALEPFAKLAGQYDSYSERSGCYPTTLLVSDLRKARAALTAARDTEGKES